MSRPFVLQVYVIHHPNLFVASIDYAKIPLQAPQGHKSGVFPMITGPTPDSYRDSLLPPSDGGLNAQSSLQAIARDIAAQLKETEHLGVSQADVLAHIVESAIDLPFQLTPRRLSRTLPQYSSDFESLVAEKASSENLVSRFFEKRRLFKEFVAERKDFLKETLQQLESEHLLVRKAEQVVAVSAFAVFPASIEFVDPTALGRAVVEALTESAQED
jgi:hypothetical protein